VPDTLSKDVIELLRRHEAAILDEWMREQMADVRRSRLIEETEMRTQSKEFLVLLRKALERGAIDDLDGRDWEELRHMLADLSASRAKRGLTTSQTAAFVFSIKRSIFDRVRQQWAGDAERLTSVTWAIDTLLDRFGLYMTEVYQKGREEVISRQQQEMLELSTPVVELWEGILALPLIGTLDSARTQVVMESLLQRIVETGAAIAIIDITGVATVDTLVAQHLLKTVAAARLMGADCIISGIRPQIAQTIVHLGVDLQDVITKATLADAFGIALTRAGLGVRRLSAPTGTSVRAPGRTEAR